MQLLVEGKANIRGRDFLEDKDDKALSAEQEAALHAARTAFNWEQSPLSLAAKGGHLETCRYLLDAKMDVNYVDEMGNDPLMVAFANGHQDLIFFLVESGANVKSMEDWNKLIQVPALVLKIAEGMASRQKIMLEAVKNTTNRNLIQKYYRPGLTMEVGAICTYVQHVFHWTVC